MACNIEQTAAISVSSVSFQRCRVLTKSLITVLMRAMNFPKSVTASPLMICFVVNGSVSRTAVGYVRRSQC